MKHLVDQAPKPDPNRKIDRAAENMPDAQKDEFLRAGNHLLVLIPYKCNILSYFLGQCTKLQSTGWWPNAIRSRDYSGMPNQSDADPVFYGQRLHLYS